MVLSKIDVFIDTFVFVWYCIDLAQSLIWENRRHEDEMNSLQQRLSRVQDELGQYTHEKATLDAKLIELDQLVGQLLGLNETLVSQLSGRSLKSSSGRLSSSSSITSATKKTTKKKKSASSSKVPRAAALSTVAAEAAKAAKDILSRPASKLIPVKTNDVEQLKSLHKMYANMAKKLTSSPSKSKRSGSPSKRADSSVLSSKSDGSGSKRKTRMSGKKGILTNSSSKMHADDLQHHDVYIPKPAVSFEKSYESDHSQSRHHHHNTNNTNTSYYSETEASDYEDYSARKEFNSYLNNLHQSPNPTSNTSYHSSNPTPQSANSQSSHAKSNAELQSIISTLEEEFDSLNRQYRSLLNNVNADSNTVPASTTTESIQAQAEEIVHVIQKLHHKGEQLRLLKSPQKN